MAGARSKQNHAGLELWDSPSRALGGRCCRLATPAQHEIPPAHATAKQDPAVELRRHFHLRVKVCVGGVGFRVLETLAGIRLQAVAPRLG